MTALACLKIVVGETPANLDPETLTALVTKVAGTYLEAKWTWPRRYGQVAPFAFALADPRATRLDATELQRLSAEIHLMLFGRQGAGEVAMLMLEGEQAEVMRFAGAGATTLASLMEGRDDGTFKGRICKITPAGAISVTPAGGPVDGTQLPDGAPREPEPPSPWLQGAAPRSRWLGIYMPTRERFIGSLAESPMWDEVGALSPSEAEIMVQDMACLRLAGDVMKEAATGIVFVPLNFTGLIKPLLRQAYTPVIGVLEQGWRSRIAASVYETPRAPSLTALRQVQTLLQPFFSLIDLQVTDPAFDIEGLPVRVVTSVSLILERQGERERLAAITRFAAAAQTYKLKRVLQGVGVRPLPGVVLGVVGVRPPREVETCRRLKVAFISGPGVSSAAPTPWGDISWPADQLPYQ